MRAEKVSHPPLVVSLATYRSLPVINRAILHLMITAGEAVVVDDDGDEVPVVKGSAGGRQPPANGRKTVSPVVRGD